MLIPISIAPAEILVRGIVRPLFYAGNKLRPLAFTPPPGRADVSVLRLIYTNPDFCKAHSQSLVIPNNAYAGMAVVMAQAVAEAKQVIAHTEVTVMVTATPLLPSGEVADLTLQIDSGDPGLPMHADIVYNQTVVRGEVNPHIQLAARHLLSRATYYGDPNIPTAGWTGPGLVAPPCVAA